MSKHQVSFIEEMRRALNADPGDYTDEEVEMIVRIIMDEFHKAVREWEPKVPYDPNIFIEV